MDPTTSTDTLTRFDWVAEDPPVRRLVFRRDGTGFYERDPEPGHRAIRENLLWKLEPGGLLLKLAHARHWSPIVAATLTHEDVAADARLGRHVLVLATDPYAREREERDLGPLRLLSDSGASLDG